MYNINNISSNYISIPVDTVTLAFLVATNPTLFLATQVYVPWSVETAFRIRIDALLSKTRSLSRGLLSLFQAMIMGWCLPFTSQRSVIGMPTIVSMSLGDLTNFNSIIKTSQHSYIMETNIFNYILCMCPF